MCNQYAWEYYKWRTLQGRFNISPAYGTDLSLPRTQMHRLLWFWLIYFFFFRFLMWYNQLKNEYWGQDSVQVVRLWSQWVRFLPPPPDFHSEISDNISQGFVTSTQISEGSNSADLFSSPPRKKICHEKFSKQEALDLMESAADHAEAAQQMLELLAGRTFANVSGEDLFDMEKVQDKLRRKLDRLTKEVKIRKFKHHKLKVNVGKHIIICSY